MSKIVDSIKGALAVLIAFAIYMAVGLVIMSPVLFGLWLVL